MGKFESSFEQADLIKSLDVWGEATMDAEDLAFNDGCDSEVIKDLDAVLPWVSVAVLADALVIESVDGSDLPGLVVSSEEGDAVWVLQLEAQEQLKSFNGVVATIDEITHEHIARVGYLTTFFK